MELPFGRKHFERKVSEAVEKRAVSAIDGYWPDATEGGGHAVASVSRSLSLVPVFGAARLLADMVASLTPVLYSLDSRGIPQRQPTPSLFAQPSIHGTLYDWLFRAVHSMALQGDAIGLVTAKDYYGWPTMIEWLDPQQVATQDGKLYGPGSYMNPQWWWWGRPLDPREILHVPWCTMPYRIRGLSPIGAYQLTTNVGIGAKEFAANWFGQGGVPPGTFQNKERTIDEEDARTITNRITARLQARKPLVYGNDWTYTPVAIKPHEAEFVETMRLTATDIAVIYGLPPEKLGGSTGNALTYTTVELNSIDMLTFSLRPWLRRFEYALSRCFPPSYFVKFDVHDMLLLDAKTRAEIDSTSLGYQNAGWKDRDEVRATYDMPPQAKPNTVHAPLLVKPAAPQQGSDLNDDDNKTGQPQLNGNGNGNNNGHHKVSATNTSLGAARQLPPKTYKNGREALMEVIAMQDDSWPSWPPKDERAVVNETPPHVEHRESYMRDRV